MFTFFGIGTTLYGKREKGGGWYTATMWFVIFYVPIFPVRSYRVSKLQQQTVAIIPGVGFFSDNPGEYQMQKLPRLNWKQVINCYVASFFIIALILGFLWIFPYIIDLMKAYPGSLGLILLLTLIGFPILIGLWIGRYE